MFLYYIPMMMIVFLFCASLSLWTLSSATWKQFWFEIIWNYKKKSKQNQTSGRSFLNWLYCAKIRLDVWRIYTEIAWPDVWAKAENDDLISSISDWQSNDCEKRKKKEKKDGNDNELTDWV